MTDLVLTRTLEVDAETAFAFVTQTQHLLKWWGPEGMSVPEHRLDFTTPGPWTSTMVNAEGGRYKVSGEVISVDSPRSVEFSWAWHDENDERGHESRVRFDVEPQENGGVQFRLTHSGLPDEESRNNHNTGWTSSLRKLERLAA